MRFSTEKTLSKQVLEAVLNHKLLIISVFLLMVVSGMFATFLITPKYEATMSILVSRVRSDPQISPSERPSNSTQVTISDEEFNSELELIRGSEIITAVINELDLTHNQAPQNETWLSNLRTKIKLKLYGSSEQEAGKTKNSANQADDFSFEKNVNRISGNLSVVPTKKSRIIKVSYTDTDPLRAKKTLEKIYEKYFALRVSLNEKVREKEESQAGEVFNDLSGNFSRKLNSSTNRLKKFDVENDISGAETGVQKELLLKQLYETQSQLSSTHTEIVETQQRITDLQQKVNAQPEQIQTGSVSKYVSAVDKIKEELSQLEQQRTQLLQKYQPNSRPVRENEDRIQQLKKAVADEIANPPVEKSYALNDVRRRLENDLLNAQTNLVVLKEREKSLAPLVSKLRTQTTFLNSKTIERAGLEREKNINEEAYLLYQKKARENEISQALNREKVVNLSLVDPPRTDGEIINPKPMLNLLVLMFIGGTAGFASAIVLDKFTNRQDDDLIISAREIEGRLNLPLLASISEIELPKTIKLIPSPKRIFPLSTDKKRRKSGNA